MTRPQLEARVRSLEASVTSRGRRMGGLYSVIRHLERIHPNRVELDTKPLREQFEALKGIESAPTELGDCVICYEKFNNTDHKAVAINCGHIVCITCAIALESTRKCPHCRTAMTSVIPLFV